MVRLLYPKVNLFKEMSVSNNNYFKPHFVFGQNHSAVFCGFFIPCLKIHDAYCIHSCIVVSMLKKLFNLRQGHFRKLLCKFEYFSHSNTQEFIFQVIAVTEKPLTIFNSVSDCFADSPSVNCFAVMKYLSLYLQEFPFWFSSKSTNKLNLPNDNSELKITRQLHRQYTIYAM